jgi:hypothetical protein
LNKSNVSPCWSQQRVCEMYGDSCWLQCCYATPPDWTKVAHYQRRGMGEGDFHQLTCASSKAGSFLLMEGVPAFFLLSKPDQGLTGSEVGGLSVVVVACCCLSVGAEEDAAEGWHCTESASPSPDPSMQLSDPASGASFAAAAEKGGQISINVRLLSNLEKRSVCWLTRVATTQSLCCYRQSMSADPAAPRSGPAVAYPSANGPM